MPEGIRCENCGREVPAGAECPGCGIKAPGTSGLLSRKGPARSLWIILEILFVLAMIWAVIDKFT